jgi:plastocyanin
MRRLLALVVAGLVGVSLAAGVADAGRADVRHRLTLPPPDLPHALAVDEAEYTMIPSENVVAAGQITVHAYNRGQDDHDVLFYDAKGNAHTVLLHPGTSGTLTADLKPGTYKFVCSLFAGTPQSHEALGMHFVLTVK